MDDFQLQTRKLYNAALEGDITSLLKLLQEDPLILDRFTVENSGYVRQSPLHVAVSNGHLEFTIEILSRKAELTEELDQIRRRSPLHMASGKGHLEIVKALLSVNPNMCLEPDIDGLNPVHVAAIRGQVHVLDELLKAVPQAARERTDAGSTVLHLCVKYCQTDALKFLINVLDDSELLNFRDVDGNTVLHLAVASKQPEMVKFLLKNKNMEKNAINKSGLTTMDVYHRNKKDINDSEIRVPLKQAKALKAKTTLKPQNMHETWLENQRNALMVVASLIATMAFQVGINPPGGAWQDNQGHVAGNSIMADVESAMYDRLLVSNTVGLISSLSVILLLISGLPFKRLFVGILMITMWIAVTATTVSYAISVTYLTGIVDLQVFSLSKPHQVVLLALGFGIILWIILMALLFLGHAARFIVKLIRGLARLVGKLCKG